MQKRLKKIIIYTSIILFIILIIKVIDIIQFDFLDADDIKILIDDISKTDDLILNDVDFSDGKYVLYIKHKELGEFAVVDQELIKANRDSLKVDVSWFNFFPGETDRSFGIMLFKNQQLIKSETGGIFNIFEIGNLKKGSVPVKEYAFNGVKSTMKSKIDSLKKSKNSYITYLPELPKDDKEFYFNVDFPCIAVPITKGLDENGNQKILTVNGIEYSKWNEEKENDFDEKWTSKIKNCIKNKAGEITDFKISISKNNFENLYLVDVKKDLGNELRNSENVALSLGDFFYYEYKAYIAANKENAEKLFAIDYNGCISDMDRNKPKVVAKMKDLVKQSTKPNLSVEKEEVGLLDYKDTVTKSKTISEQKYVINWLEIEK